MSTIYVNTNATGGGDDGSSWSNAYTDLQSALGTAGNGDQIWVAEGTYNPTDDDNREISFVIPSGVEVYGGFTGVETGLNQRDYENNVTILSGNIGEDTAGDNSYHVVNISNTNTSTILDGLTITGGQADGENAFRVNKEDGGGIRGGTNASATLRNLTITDNFAIADGGGIFVGDDSNPTIINVTFDNNSASDNGGAIHFDNDGNLNVINSLFVNNQSQSAGAIYIRNAVDSFNIINNTFYNNQGNTSDAIFDDSGRGNDTNIINNVFWSSSAINRPQILLERIFISGSLPEATNFSNNIVKGEIPSFERDIDRGRDVTLENNSTEDPLFVDPENNDFRLQLNSPGIDAGDNEAINEEQDIENNPRVFNDTVDIGAYEYGVLMSIEDVTLTEGDEGTTNADFTVTLLDSLGEPATEEITVNYATEDDTATAGEDFTTTEGTLTFNIGDTTKTISVPVTGDELIESRERFSVLLSGITGNAEIVDGRGFATISNDDQRKEITISDATIDEGNEGEQAIEFTVSLNESYVEDITVDYNVVENTATPGNDYTDINGTITFEPGETEQTISVIVSGDTNFEAGEDETFFVRLSNGSDNATIEDNQAIGTIINDDDEPDEPTVDPEDVLDTDITRFQNSDIPGTYLFAGDEESEGIRENFPNFEEEGTAFKVAIEAEEDSELIPLYRFQSTRTPGTYLFAGEEERQGINENFSEDFNEEGLAFYVYGADSDVGTTFYRFQNEDRPGTYIFAGPEERQGILDDFPNFTEEGAAFNVKG